MSRPLPIGTGLNAYEQKGKATALSADSTKQMAIFNVRAHNRAGSAINVGILRKLGDASWKVWKKVASAYTEITTDIQAGTATVVATLTNDDGFIVQAKRKFGLLGFTVSNAATGGTYAFEYWNGSAWAALGATIETPTDLGSTGDKYVVFLPPRDWATGDDFDGDQDMYSIKIRHSTAPADTGAINAVWLGEFLEFCDSLADNATLQVLFDREAPFICDAGEGVFPYFGTAAAGNMFAAYYSSI
jgi:hypothetical protein